MQKIQRRSRVALTAIGLTLILFVIFDAQEVAAQGSTSWTAATTIPGYHHETEPPILIADQNRTVHAFSYQWTGEVGRSERVLVYNQWSLAGGWTEPNDILLSPVKEARLLDVFLDDVGLMHLIFFGGDGDKAEIYYSKALASEAAHAPAWSEPELIGVGAEDPETGAIIGDDRGNLIVLYGGNRIGHGYYQVSSSDRGDSWSDPILVFPTFSNDLWPFYLKFYLGESGWLHAVWSVHDRDNSGLAIYYARFDFNDQVWTEPKKLAERQVRLGTQAATIIEHKGILFVAHYDSVNRNQLFIQSDDNGQSWSEPIAPFPHEGLNGPGAFVVDSNGDLHYLWAQRVSGYLGDPDITNGLWHSKWDETFGWTEYEAVVTGKKFIDLVGDKAFDPNTATPVVSQGNVLLVTWRMDRGSRGNGVWYSYATLETPELPVVPLPSELARPEPAVGPTSAPIIDPAPAAAPERVLLGAEDIPFQTTNNPLTPVFVSLGPIILLASVIIVRQALSRRRLH